MPRPSTKRLPRSSGAGISPLSARNYFSEGLLPVVRAAGLEGEAEYEAIMRISLDLADVCEAILCVGTSKGVEREKEKFIRRGCPVFTDPCQLP